MKKIIPLISMIFFSSSLFANNDAACPSPFLIRQNAIFIKAEKLVHPFNVWQLTTPVFLYQDKMWDITFSVDLKYAASPESALIEGQDYFNHNVRLAQQPVKIDKVCIYANEDYLVRATEYHFQPYISKGSLAMSQKARLWP